MAGVWTRAAVSPAARCTLLFWRALLFTFIFNAVFLLCLHHVSQTSTSIKSNEFWSTVSGPDEAEAGAESRSPSPGAPPASQALHTQPRPWLRCARISAVVLAALLSFLPFSLPFVTNCWVSSCTGGLRGLCVCWCQSSLAELRGEECDWGH